MADVSENGFLIDQWLFGRADDDENLPLPHDHGRRGKAFTSIWKNGLANVMWDFHVYTGNVTEHMAADRPWRSQCPHIS